MPGNAAVLTGDTYSLGPPRCNGDVVVCSVDNRRIIAWSNVVMIEPVYTPSSDTLILPIKVNLKPGRDEKSKDKLAHYDNYVGKKVAV